VTFVTNNELLGHIAAAELELPHLLPRLERAGLRAINGHELLRLDDRIAVLAPVSGGTQSTVRDVDAVVYSTLRLPANDLWLQLRERHPDVRCIGDAASPRSTADVIQEGEEAARLLER
jgi:hypothetical protein